MGGHTLEPEFAHLLWHDNPVYGLRLEIGDPDAGDWRSDLVPTSTISSPGPAAVAVRCSR
jgi:hypothetical protein